MHPSHRVFTFGTLSFGLAHLLAAATLGAQDPVPAPNPDLPRLLKELKDLVSDKKAALDFQAIGLIQVLAKDPEQRNPKDRDKVCKAIAEVFRTGKVRPADQDLLYREAADALTKFGEDGAKELRKICENKRFDDLLPLRAHLLVCLGRTEDPDQVEFLADTATRAHQDELRAAAGEALGFYTSLADKPRREVVKQLLREWGSLHAKATQPDSTDPAAPIDTGPQNARRTLRAVEAKWQRTLTRLTGVQHSQFPEWQRWLNKNPNWPVPPSPQSSPKK